ncbi:MAG: HyaD/HybD family hydrogenase maturation endopeptidase, partial [Nitrospirae bacterium]
MAACVVLGLGNPLWGDEGFGVRAAEGLHAAYELPPGVELVDGGTQGFALLPWVARAERLLILDAVDFGLAPGSLRLVRGEGVPRYLGARKVSMHQTGFQEVLAVASLAGELPAELALVGVQPARLDFGAPLSPEAAAALGPAVAAAVAELRRWGLAP